MRAVFRRARWHAARLRRRARRPPPGRSRAFRREFHDRYWWHRLQATDYVPPLYAA